MYCNFALSVSILLFILLSLIYLLVVQRFSGIDSFMRNPFDENVLDGQFFFYKFWHFFFTNWAKPWHCDDCATPGHSLIMELKELQWNNFFGDNNKQLAIVLFVIQIIWLCSSAIGFRLVDLFCACLNLYLTQGHPWWPNLAICVIFGTFWESHERHDPKVRVSREKFNIGFSPKLFGGSSYTCMEARKKIWAKKSMLNFSW